MDLADVACLRERPPDREHAEDIREYLVNNDNFVLGSLTLNAIKREDIKVAISASNDALIKDRTTKSVPVYLLIRNGALLQIADGQHRKVGIAHAGKTTQTSSWVSPSSST